MKKNKKILFTTIVLLVLAISCYYYLNSYKRENNKEKIKDTWNNRINENDSDSNNRNRDSVHKENKKGSH